MKTTSRSGYTVIEVAIAGFILAVIVGGVLVSVSQMVSSAQTTSTDTSLHAMGRRVLTRIQDDLQRSGFFADPGVARYPYLFEGGNADAPFDAHDHDAPNPPLWAVGLNREIVFRVPSDADGDGTPDLTADNECVWGADEISYVVVPSVDGGNVLERRINGAMDRVVGRYIDRVVFDDAVSAAGEVPLDAIRVTVDLGKVDHTGVVHKHTAETLFRLRNGGIVGL